MKQRFADVCIVGAGIVGLAHARAAALRGKSVVVFERNASATGASVRNFGMIWPIGLSGSPLYPTALKSRQIWLETSAAAGFWCSPCGSVHLARADDELAVLREFERTPAGLAASAHVVDAAEAVRRCPLARTKGLASALWSDTEVAVSPRHALPAIVNYLATELAVEFRYGESVVAIDAPHLRSSQGETWRFDTAIVCSNIDADTLFPQLLSESGLVRCKLQMLRTAPQPRKVNEAVALAAGGLTLRHYANFQQCPSLKTLKARIQNENPLLDKFGIHVLASQNMSGEIILGDSHEYEFEPFDNPQIDELIWDYAAQLFNLDRVEIARRWHGLYLRHPSTALFEAEPQPNVLVCINANGLGMTLSFGWAEAIWSAREVIPSARHGSETLVENV